MIYLQSAGTPPETSSRLVDAIEQVVRSGNCDGLLAELERLGFEEYHGILIMLAVAVTRNLCLPAEDQIIQQLLMRNAIREEFLDALAVTFLFNSVTRIANAYDLDPEWARLGRSKLLRRAIRRFFTLALPWQMTLEDDEQQDQERRAGQIQDLLSALGLKSISPIWRELGRIPTLYRAIYQLLWVSIQCSELDDDILALITSRCIDIGEGNGNAQSVPSEGTVDEALQFAARLFAQPHAINSYDVTKLRRSGFDEKQILDFVFRVSLLAGVFTLNCDVVRRLGAEIFR